MTIVGETEQPILICCAAAEQQGNIYVKFPKEMSFVELTQTSRANMLDLRRLKCKLVHKTSRTFFSKDGRKKMKKGRGKTSF